MVLKVLMLNFPHGKNIDAPNNVNIFESEIKQLPTLHDFHAIIMDTSTVLNSEFWGLSSDKELVATIFTEDAMRKYSKKVKEQIETGGTTFLFCGNEKYSYVLTENIFEQIQRISITNYFCSPIDLGVVNNQGDTFYPSLGDLKYYSPLVKSISKEQITYECYFSKLPEETKILGTNRANYPIFAEVPIGNGKLVILPRFKDMTKVTNILVKEIIPQIIHEEEPIFVPMWLSEFSTEFEKRANNMVYDIGKVKRLLYTKGKLLEKAVAFAFEKMGFSVEKPPNGTNPDIEIFTEKKKALCEVKGCEVKGHTNRQSNRKDMYQLLTYSEEDGKAEKGILVSNSEYCKDPKHRKKEAFTDGAIRLGTNAEFSLLNLVELFEVTMLILQGKITEPEKKALRDKIINGIGLVHISQGFAE